MKKRKETGGEATQLRRVLMTAFDLLCICLTSMCVCVGGREGGGIVVVVVMLLSVPHFIISYVCVYVISMYIQA